MNDKIEVRRTILIGSLKEVIAISHERKDLRKTAGTIVDTIYLPEEIAMHLPELLNQVAGKHPVTSSAQYSVVEGKG